MPSYQTARRLARRLVAPVPDYESSTEDARRFALLICIVFAVAGYLFVEESNRRDRLANIVFYDHILHAMEHFDSAMSSNGDVYRPRLSQTPSPILEHLDSTVHEVPSDTISTVTGSVTQCEVEYYRVSATGGVVAGSDRAQTAWAFAGEYLLVFFPFQCNALNQPEPTYALIGDFSLAVDNTEYRPDNADRLVIHDWYGEYPAGPAPAGSSPLLFYHNFSSARSRLLRIAQNTAGRYYAPEHYRDAIVDLSTAIQEAPTVLGVSLPPMMTVLALPLVLFMLSFSFYHRVRRIRNNGRAAWVLVTHTGFIETTASVLWKATLVLAVIMVYLTASLYIGARPELEGDIPYIWDQNASTESVNILNASLWVAGVRNLYIVSMCALSLAVIILGLVVMKRHVENR